MSFEDVQRECGLTVDDIRVATFVKQVLESFLSGKLSA
jgi:hypothetical protein